MSGQKLNQRNIIEFNNWAKIYDWKIFKWGFRKSYDTVKNNLPNLSNKKLLSIACGTATLETELASKFPKAQIFCIDQSMEMLKRAKEKSKGLKNIYFTQSTADNLPFKNSHFDFVICLNAFHHFPYQEKSLEEVSRVLKNSGLFYYADQIKDGFSRRFHAWFNDLFEKGVFHYTILELKDFLKKENLKINKIQKNLRGTLVIAEKN